MSEEKKDVIKSKEFEMKVKISDDRLYTFKGPGGEHATDIENPKEIESVLYYLLKNMIITNWRKDIIDAENARAAKEKEEPEAKEQK